MLSRPSNIRNDVLVHVIMQLSLKENNFEKTIMNFSRICDIYVTRSYKISIVLIQLLDLNETTYKLIYLHFSTMLRYFIT